MPSDHVELIFPMLVEFAEVYIVGSEPKMAGQSLCATLDFQKLQSLQLVSLHLFEPGVYLSID